MRIILFIVLALVNITADPSRARSPYPDVWTERGDAGYCVEHSGHGWSNTVIWPTNQRTIREGRGFSDSHPAIDISGAIGDPVCAAATGVVSWAGWSRTGGNMVVLAHGGGWRTYYVHLDSVSVSCGHPVSAGEQIGELGSTRTGWPHLHFEIERKEQSTRYGYDPLHWLSGAEYVPGEAPFSQRRTDTSEQGEGMN
jgi:murein DD-endopeptidase MepM/ murein hydrolase activator NlpD